MDGGRRTVRAAGRRGNLHAARGGFLWAVAPSVLKSDGEGAELEVLRGGAGIIARHRPLVFLSTHGEATHGACLGWLRDHGYGVEPILEGDPDAAAGVLAVPGRG